MNCKSLLFLGDCEEIIKNRIASDQTLLPISLTFLDPPFNQGKAYEKHKDNMNPEEYWTWMTRICKLVYDITKPGGSIYFMQREKNTEYVLCSLREAGWTLQNVIIWKKLTSAVPQSYRYGKQYQIIAFATKGARPAVFHRLRIDAPLAPYQKMPRKNGIYVTDVWDDIRELTSGYFAGDEALRDPKTKKRLHEQQAPIALLLRIILSSTNIGDIVLDPFAGTGTTNIVAMQLQRKSIGIEISSTNYEIIKHRIDHLRKSDTIEKYRQYYRFTPKLELIWPFNEKEKKKKELTKYLRFNG